MPDNAITLTEDQIEIFFREGYLAIDRITDQADVARLRESYDRIFEQKAGRDEGNQFDLGGTDDEGSEAVLPQILEPARYAPEMLESNLYRNVAAIGKQLLGESCVCSFAHAIFKPPRSGAPTPWHQDAAYWNPSMIHHSISVWVPLQEATLDNGCMHFVPASHTRDVVTHRSINNDPRIHGLELDPSLMHLVEDAVACPLPPGGATFHGGYMLHYTPPNRSDIPRRALILNLGVPGTPRPEPRTFPWLESKRTARMERTKTAGNR